ncbi:MAG: hypothetical protein CSA11_01825 [Chloroflexi bacterium]|nr:MAG: hypothetical protein CSB13_10145 [Chloroflexota bacterium]PIE82067.1 MAG: hypothetical protein CSA11_01825 [Chloroflexota bacterium]
MESKHEYHVAADLDTAWANFEPDLPLQTDTGKDHPFYVNRSDTVMKRLKRKLLRSYMKPPKYFLSGHRGCGKSTELYRLAANRDIRDRYWPVHFSIRDHADLNDLDFKEVLLAMGGRLYNQYEKEGSKDIDKQLQKELASWRGSLEEEVTTLQAGRLTGEVGAEIGSLFANLSSKIKLEPKTRHEIRQVLERDVTGLVTLINNIINEITAKEGKQPLILIDDLDKITDLGRARQIFIDQQGILRQPACPIVYTISSSLFYDPKFPTVRIEPIFLPNITLHEHQDRSRRNEAGHQLLQTFVLRRIKQNLITDAALEKAAAKSGGVFRELVRLLRDSLDFSQDADQAVITETAMTQAATELRNTYWRVLTQEQLDILRDIRKGNDKHDPQEIGPLLQMLAVLEYDSSEGSWYDVHPVLEELLLES